MIKNRKLEKGCGRSFGPSNLSQHALPCRLRCRRRLLKRRQRVRMGNMRRQAPCLGPMLSAHKRRQFLSQLAQADQQRELHLARRSR